MTQRTSLIEQYNNRDVIAQIYRIIDIAEHGAIESLNVEKIGAIVRLLFTMHDGTVHTIEFPANGIVDITSAQDGSTMNVTITLDDGTERTISWTIVPGVTLDTAQTIPGAKTFSALMTLLAGLGITGTVTIDGDTQITNGHSLSVAGDIDSAGTLKGDAAEIRGPVTVAGDITAEGATVSDQADIAGMAIEPNGSKTTLSNDNGIESASPMNLTGQVTMTNIPTTSTGVRDTKAANGTRIQNDLDNYAPMLRNTGNQEPVLGIKKSAFIVNNPIHLDSFSTFNGGWHNIYDLNLPQGRWIGKLTIGSVSNTGIESRTGYLEAFVDLDGNSDGYLKILISKGSYDITSRVKLCHDDEGWHLLFNCGLYIRHGFSLTPLVFGWQANDTSYHVSDTYSAVVDEPDVARYDKIVSCTEW